MAKYGYREGQGLGKSEQGMSTALYVEKTSKRGGKIIHEKDMPKGNIVSYHVLCPKVIVLLSFCNMSNVIWLFHPVTCQKGNLVVVLPCHMPQGNFVVVLSCPVTIPTLKYRSLRSKHFSLLVKVPIVCNYKCLFCQCFIIFYSYIFVLQIHRRN